MKNKEWILDNLKDAKQELDRTIKQIQENPEYNYGEFRVAMEHLYHHLNTAWNSQDVNPQKIESQTDELFVKWRQFPEDLNMST